MSAFNRTISRVLTAGLLVSVALLVIGIVLTIGRPDVISVHKVSVGSIPKNIAALRAGGFFDLGLLVLVATPAIRAVALLVGFARRRMWLFSVFSAIVLIVLALSAFIGLQA